MTDLLAALLLPLLLPAPSAGAQAEPWTLEAIFRGDDLRASLPSGLTWLPDGEAFLYRATEEESTRLVRHAVATGEETTVLDWSALQDELRSRRPGHAAPPMDDTNRTGRFSFDPRLSPDGTHLVGTVADDLYAVDLASGEARFLTSAPGPELFFRFRPDSGAVAFTRDGDLFAVDLASGEETRLTDRGDDATLLNGVADWVYEEELGLQQSFWWCPDGARIAYLQFDTSPVSVFPITDELELVAGLERQRYPKTGAANSRVRLGVLDLGTGETLWVASGDAPEGYLVDAGWVDAEHLWYLWLDRDQTRLELRLFAADGTTRTLAVEEDERWVDVGPDPVFLSDGTFLWTSERDGWRHLYRYGLDGELRGRLTEGPWEVTSVDGLTAGDEAVVYQSTERSPVERHVYRVGLDGGGKRALTPEGGWHSASLSPAGDAWIDSWSSAATPPRMELVSAADGSVLRTLADGRVPGLEGREFSVPELELAEVAEGRRLWTSTIRPHDFDPDRRYPVVVYVYGGPGAQLVRDRWGGQRGSYMQYLAQEGAVVFTIDNRGSGGRGREFTRQLYRRLGTLEVEDQALGVEWLARKPWVDGERVGIYGGSYGGFMTLNCLLRRPERFDAGVAYAPVTDFRLYDTIYTERYMDTPRENAAGYDAGAPLQYAEGLEGALLLVHGTMDNNVHFQNSVKMIDALAEAEKAFDLMVYPRTRHSMGNADYELHFHRLSAEFLARELGFGGGS